MLCPVYGHELTPLSCPPSQGVSFRSFKGNYTFALQEVTQRLKTALQNGPGVNRQGECPCSHH